MSDEQERNLDFGDQVAEGGLYEVDLEGTVYVGRAVDSGDAIAAARRLHPSDYVKLPKCRKIDSVDDVGGEDVQKVEVVNAGDMPGSDPTANAHHPDVTAAESVDPSADNQGKPDAEPGHELETDAHGNLDPVEPEADSASTDSAVNVSTPDVDPTPESTTAETALDVPAVDTPSETPATAADDDTTPA